MSHYNASAYGITYNGRHSYRDLGLRVISKSLTLPAKAPIQTTPAYSNTPIDLTALYGVPLFGERTFSVTFLVINAGSMDKTVLYEQWTQTVNWLQGSIGRSVLVDDIQPEFYYMAEAVDACEWEEFRSHGKFTVKFTCNPFRVKTTAEGSDVWDDFNFTNDIAQWVQYFINGTQDITLYNVGINVAEPDIEVTGDIQLTFSGVTVSPGEGRHSALDMATPLQIPANASASVVATGTGTVAFVWHKEVI